MLNVKFYGLMYSFNFKLNNIYKTNVISFNKLSTLKNCVKKLHE